MADPTPITDPQSQSGEPLPDANFHTVDNVPVTAGDDNQRILARQTPTGVSRGVQQLGGPSLTADSGNKRITVTDSVPQVLMGSQPTFGEGFYVSKPGIDVTTTTTTNDFIFNSNQNVFKIVKSGNISFPALSLSNPGAGNYNSGTAFVTVPHGLGFASGVIAYITNSGLYFPTPYVNFAGAGTSCRWYELSVIVNSVYVIAEIDVTVTGQSWNSTDGEFTAKYYLLQETAT